MTEPEAEAQALAILIGGEAVGARVFMPTNEHFECRYCVADLTPLCGSLVGLPHRKSCRNLVWVEINEQGRSSGCRNPD